MEALGRRPPLKKRLLVTTALAESQIEGRESVLLGEWCKLPAQRERWLTTPHEVLPFHWADVGKRAADYRYLENLVAEVMIDLAGDLNACHGEDLPPRYWRIVLGSWLSMYVATLFDRWEAVRLAFRSQEQFESLVVKPTRFDGPPSGSLDHVLRAVDDRYNHELFADLIEQHYPEQCDLTPIRPPSASADSASSSHDGPASAAAKGAARRLIRNVVSRLAKRQRNNDVVFANCYFSWGALIRLNLLLGQLPRQYPEFTWNPPSHDPKHGLRTLRKSLEARTTRRDGDDPFLAYLWRRISTDIPSSYVEGLADLRSASSSLSLKCKVIVTANSHWHNELFKVWAAERVLDGAKLVICEHGGSFPAAQYVLDFEENMADVYVPTYRAHHPKHVQLPPTKYLDVKETRNRRASFATIIAYNGPRYAIRASSQPHSSQALDVCHAVIRIVDALPSEIRALVRVKLPAHSSVNWELDFVDRFGQAGILPELPLDRAFGLSRLLICTYPQSTFAEAMLSGVPTVMFFDPGIHGLHQISNEVVAELRRAKVIFFDAAEAAEHIAKIWEDPVAWWQRHNVKRARELYFDATMTRGRWPVYQWASFLRGFKRKGHRTQSIRPAMAE